MSLPAITADGLGKQYRKGLHLEPYRTARDAIAGLFRPKSRARVEAASPFFWALRDVAFEIQPGDAVGIVGRNGAGKTTLLKILSRVTNPTTGRVELRGRVGTLLEVGTGFHLELTGRENVKLNGAILGMSRREIDRRFDEIVEFAGVQEFIDTPVKRYSSGMFMRLAFSVAAHLDPEILIVDEVLAVGDAEFQQRCLGKLGSVGQEGRTVIFVSHNLTAVRQLCSRALLLESGRLERDGPVDEILDEYLARFTPVTADVRFTPDPGVPVAVTRLRTCRVDGEAATHFNNNEEVVLEAEFQVTKKVEDVRLWAWLYLADGTWLIGSTDAEANPDPPEEREPGIYVSRFTVPAEILNEGTYQFRFLISKKLGTRTWDHYDDKQSGFFEISDQTDYSGSDLGKRKSLVLVPLSASEARVDAPARSLS